MKTDHLSTLFFFHSSELMAHLVPSRSWPLPIYQRIMAPKLKREYSGGHYLSDCSLGAEFVLNPPPPLNQPAIRSKLMPSPCHTIFVMPFIFDTVHFTVEQRAVSLEK